MLSAPALSRSLFPVPCFSSAFLGSPHPSTVGLGSLAEVCSPCVQGKTFPGRLNPVFGKQNSEGPACLDGCVAHTRVR